MTAAPAGEADWTTYDEFAGPSLSGLLWEPLRFGSQVCLEPGASTEIADGICTIHVATFTRSDDHSQGVDDCKHVLLSKRAFELPADGLARFEVDLRAELVPEASGDYRRGFAAFVVIDTSGATQLVANVLCTGDRYLVEHEVLPGLPGVDPFVHVVDDPFFFSRSGVRTTDGFHRCRVEVDRPGGRITWSVDGRTLYEADGLSSLPEQVHLGLGLFTALPLGIGRGSCHGQGIRASWRGLRFALTGSGQFG